MSTFLVERRKISDVKIHPNADRLDICKVEGMNFQFVCQRGTQTIGGDVVYFPVDALFPKELSDFFDITKMLTGKEHNRLKTVKLRNEISQGFVVDSNRVCEYLNSTGQNYTLDTLPIDCTQLLKIEKYEPPVTMEKNAKLIPLSGKIEMYDIEGSQRFPNVIDYMMDKKVMISEKVEGMNGGCSYFLNDMSIKVNQRNFFIEPKDGVEHTFWTLCNKYNLPQICKELAEKYNNDITIRFEVLGENIQKNIYSIKGFDIKIFDIKCGEGYLNVNEFLEICNKYNLPTVPILAKDITLREWLNGKTFEDASNGKSVLYDGLREGVVCKLEKEEIIEGYGRSIIKNRSTDYLVKSEF
jgi:RNA ligase (TIGR02306 family)